ncbi:hypothetical protein GYMLUDRAFT_43301 [Collybiopsis luxurians FD-317 M1]|uniref:Uncharacterized protein n=1 Tax=Collybiopsis luxurians FD-317 M1 TaxID=944289 RepID=A0A0D0CF68_9AGAR|nr:hypothetical protein GYMLUDRAFT_43301 [Collybiopsis luxurians FD-317 M1]
MTTSIATVCRNVTSRIRTVGDVGFILILELQPRQYQLRTGNTVMAAWMRIHKACPQALLLAVIPTNHMQMTKSILNRHLLSHPARFNTTIPHCTCGKRHHYSHSFATPRASFIFHLLYTVEKISI